MNGGSVPCGQSGGHLARGGGGVAVLLRVRTVAVAVLEVDAEVLDRLAAELLGDAGVDRGGQVLPQPDRRGEVRGGGAYSSRARSASAPSREAVSALKRCAPP